MKLEDVFALESVREIEVKGGPTMKRQDARYATYITVRLALGVQGVPILVEGKGETLGASYYAAVLQLRDEFHERLSSYAQAASATASAARNAAFKLNLRLEEPPS